MRIGRALVLATIMVQLAAMSASKAQSPPLKPVHPKSESVCRDFQASYKSHLDWLRKQWMTCDATYKNDRPETYSPGFRCPSAGIVKGGWVPLPCVGYSDRWTCAVNSFGTEVNDCLREAELNQHENARDKSDSLSKSFQAAMADTFSDSGKSTAEKLGKWWLGQSGNSAILKALEVEGFSGQAQAIKSIFGEPDPLRRAQAFTSFFGETGNVIATEMTSLAIKGIAGTGREAVNTLVSGLSQFTNEVDGARANARLPPGKIPEREEDAPTSRSPSSEVSSSRESTKPEWQCFASYDACTSYCRQTTGVSSNGAWCSGICSPGGTHNRPTPSEFGSQLCYHAQ